ncbi:hypothetical protein HYR99_19320 [Candidatus Poribacteria bacterium]|nr:hypothetical protein [Candidatus Poribacteria bacterium]
METSHVMHGGASFDAYGEVIHAKEFWEGNEERRVAVKGIDPRGNEVMGVHELGGY